MEGGDLATVGDLLARDVGLYAHCQRCQHGSRIDLKPIIDRHGLGYPISRVVKRLRCKNCFRLGEAEIRLVPSGTNPR